MTAKVYNEMTAAEQLQWVMDFSSFANKDLAVLMELREQWLPEHRKMMERGLRLMLAFPFSKEYAETALQWGDYYRRTYRLPHYVERIKKEISQSVAVSDGNGNMFAYVPQLRQTQRRRGRPTREEAYLYQQQQIASQENDIETEKQQAIARLLGLEVITNPAGREKNNDEMRAEREAKAVREAKMNPGLFEDEAAAEPLPAENAEAGGDGGAAVIQQQTGQKETPPSGIAAMSQARLHLDQLSWLLSPELKERVAAVRQLRSNAAAYAEQAKLMAERGDNPKLIEPVALGAAECTEAYEQIYDDVDRELATVCYRLKHDEPFTSRFMKRFGMKDVSGIVKELKPYLAKMPPEFEVGVKNIIEQENPEFIAKVKAEKAKKQEVDAIIKYLRRKDKTATKKRVETSRVKFARLVELMGADQAQVYKPLLVVIEEEYAATAKPSLTENGVAVDAAAKPQPTENG